MKRLFPRPIATVALTLVWVMLSDQPSVGGAMMGLFLGWLIPWIFAPLMVVRTAWKPWPLAKLLVVVLGDIIVSNFHVAKLNLGPVHRLRPAFLEVPIDLENETAISILVSIVSMTPGTIAVDLSSDRNRLLVHGLDVEDPQAIIDEIKTRYEAPLKEIFLCSSTPSTPASDC